MTKTNYTVNEYAAVLREVRGDFYADLLASFPASDAANAIKFPNLYTAKKEVAESGSHYFDASTLRFFGARTYDLYGGRFLVESVKPWDGVRRYRVSWFYTTDTGSNMIQGETWPVMFDTLSQARACARSLARSMDDDGTRPCKYTMQVFAGGPFVVDCVHADTLAALKRYLAAVDSEFTVWGEVFTRDARDYAGASFGEFVGHMNRGPRGGVSFARNF